MMIPNAEAGWVLIRALLVGLLPAMLGRAAVNLAGAGPRRRVPGELGLWRTPPLHAAVQADVPPAALNVAESGPLPKVQAHWGDIVSNSPPGPWQYQTFKDYAQRFGSYYVPDREGLLYRNGMTDPSHALTPSQVFGSQEVGDQRGLVFIDN